jgi:hypothetical protein
LLVIGLGRLGAPFQCGTLVPELKLHGFFADRPDGSYLLNTTWPAGFSATNALLGRAN